MQQVNKKIVQSINLKVCNCSVDLLEEKVFVIEVQEKLN